MPIKFTHLGVEYELTAEEIEAAYRYQERQYRLLDAKEQFLQFVYGIDPDQLEQLDLEFQENQFLECYGFPVSEGFSMLEAFVDRYEDLEDSNAPVNITWQTAIEQELAECGK